MQNPQWAIAPQEDTYDKANDNRWCAHTCVYQADQKTASQKVCQSNNYTKGNANEEADRGGRERDTKRQERDLDNLLVTMDEQLKSLNNAFNYKIQCRISIESVVDEMVSLPLNGRETLIE